MSIFESAGRLGATLVAMVQTRVELASVELQEEAQRMLRYLVLSLMALFLAAMTVVLVTFFVILLFWEEHPLLATGLLAILYGFGAILLMMKVKSEIRSKPALLSHTLAELRKDVDCVRGHHG
ncbi:phage holin family protein [Pseudoduganella sp. GCM10020061]|uniref:phage holin family protein n=1 Tax=Pseudoduganella sp. GCM10020061 TaxID=3317345 RepID=UPI0036356175